MITNLFTIFDPSTSLKLASNWSSIWIWTLLIPITYWILPSRLIKSTNNLLSYIFSEFKPLIKKNPQTLILPVRLFMFIIFNNVPGLLPFIFTRSRHISTTLTIALPLWSAVILYGWFNNTSNLLIHLIPNGTPTILIPFIVVIETISNIIRPLTLAIRLAANIIAGHLLITLLTSANKICPLLLTPILFRSQIALAGLEVAVAFIQAYVFRVLITLYTSERIN